MYKSKKKRRRGLHFAKCKTSFRIRRDGLKSSFVWLIRMRNTLITSSSPHRRPDDSRKIFNIWERARNYNTNERQRQRSLKIEKLRASGKVIWAKVTTLTFMLFLLSKNMARNIFFLSYKKEWKQDCDFDSKWP